MKKVEKLESSLSGSKVSKNNYSGKTLLVVEDEVLLAMNEAEMLETYGFRVISAASAEDALAAVQENMVDLILMDIDLGHGNMDGTEAAETILEDHDIPVVFLSSHTEPEIVEKTEKITSYGYVVKNSGETVLLASIKMAFRLHDAYQKRIEKSDQLDTLLNNAEDFIGRLDRNRVHLYVNSALCNAVGIPFAEYVGKTIEELGYPAEISQKWNEAVDSVFETRKPARIEFSFPGTDADRVLDCRIVPELVHNGDVHTVVAISRDITEQKHSEKKLKYFVENTNDWVWQVDSDGRYTYSSFSAVNIIGFTPKEILGKTPFDFMEEDEANRIGPLFSEIVRNRKDIVGLEDVMIHKDGRKTIFETNAIPVFDADGSLKGYFGTCRDITERKQMEEEQNLNEARLEGLLKLHDMDGADLDKLALFVLEESERLTRSKIGFINYLSDDETEVTHAVYTASTLRQCNLPENATAFKISECGLWSEAYRLRHPIVVNDYSMDYTSKVGFPEGHPTLRRFVSIPIFDGENIVAIAALGNKKSDYNQADVRQFRLFMEGMWRILKQKQAESKLRMTIKEKDFLLEEINHRVKNNLAIVSSLIHLKDTALGESVDLSDITNQINAIALVHEKLYKSESITNINLSEYIEEMLATIFSSFTNNHVAIKNNIGEVVLPTKSAVTLGLIINEIATNAIKHGFTSDTQPEFTVSIEEDVQTGHYILSLSNSGNPFPENIDLNHPTTLGLRLISALVGQLKGTIELVRKPSPVFTIRFPAGKKQ